MRPIRLYGPTQRAYAKRMIDEAQKDSVVSIRLPNRTLDQNALFHSLCSDIAKSGLEWAGKPRTADEWKVLLVSGHTKATKGEVEIVPGLEGEFVNIRESTAKMSVSRAISLIEYVLAFAASHGIELNTEGEMA